MLPIQLLKTALIALLLFSQKIVCNISPTVTIIGAGAAGIAAATKILDNGIDDIFVLEAERRIGGRIHSVQFGDAFVDLGAQYCHGEEGNIVYELVKNYDLLQSGNLTMTVYYASHKHIDESLKNDLYELFYTIYSEDKKIDGVSLGDFMVAKYNESILENYANYPEKLKFANDFLNFLMQTTLTLEGAFSWFNVVAKSDYKECPGNLIQNWKGLGYKTILDVLLKKIPDPTKQLLFNNKLRLEKVATKVLWRLKTNHTKAVVECSDGSVYTSNHVIFTPSLGVLKEGHTNLFEPKLPEEKISAIERLGIDAVFKMFLHFPDKWWPTENFTDFSFVWTEKDKTDLIGDGSSDNDKTWLLGLLGLYAVESNPNVLLAWFCGESVPKIELLSDEILIDGIMLALNKFVGLNFDNITKPDSAMRHNWYSNPHFRGTYSYQTLQSRKEDISAETILAQPLLSSNGKPNVLFAGEATHPTYYSTVHGAIETGYREAQRIIDLYK